MDVGGLPQRYSLLAYLVVQVPDFRNHRRPVTSLFEVLKHISSIQFLIGLFKVTYPNFFNIFGQK